MRDCGFAGGVSQEGAPGAPPFLTRVRPQLAPPPRADRSLPLGRTRLSLDVIAVLSQNGYLRPGLPPRGEQSASTLVLVSAGPCSVALPYWLRSPRGRTIRRGFTEVKPLPMVPGFDG